MKNARFDELIYNLIAYEEGRNLLKLSDKERDEFQDIVESKLHPTTMEMDTPRGKLILEKDEASSSVYIGLESNIDGDFIDIAQVNYLNENNSADEKHYGELCVYTYGDAMDENYTDKKIVQNLKEFEESQMDRD